MTKEIRASDLAGERIRDIRKRRDLTAADLAEKCEVLGAAGLTEAVLANIETGRRQKDGKRRRDLTIDEVLILAAALNVPPVLLFTPVGTADELAITPSESADAFGALMWVSGEAPLPTISAEMYQEWREAAGPIILTRDIWQCMDTAAKARRNPESDQYRAALRALAIALNRWVMSGTPFPVRPDAFGQRWHNLVDDMRDQDLLDYPDEIPGGTGGEDDGSR